MLEMRLYNQEKWFSNLTGHQDFRLQTPGLSFVESRVARLGEFSLTVQLFTLGIFGKLKK
jgi:hypothetical protein